jgi:hypothetical protein
VESYWRSRRLLALAVSILTVVAGIAIAGAPRLAQAGGYWALDRGPSLFARGGANIADPKDPFAVYINPAALPNISGLQIFADYQSATDYRTFTRAPEMIDGRERTYQAVSNLWPGFSPDPGFLAAYNFKSLGLEKLTLAGGAYGPPRADDSYDPYGPQRYNQIRGYNIQIYYALAAGYELPWYRLRLGFTGLLVSQNVKTKLKIYANPVTEKPEVVDSTYDATVFVNATQSKIPCGILALSAAPIPSVILSISYQLPYTVNNATGTLDVTPEEALGKLARIQGDKVKLEHLKFPALARFAADYRDPNGDYDIEGAFVWEGWSRNTVAVLKPEIGVSTALGDIDLGDVVMDNRMRDTFSVRLGGEKSIIDDFLRLRAGTYYERSAVETKRLSVGSFDLDKVGFTVGTRIDMLKRFWLDFAIGYIYWIPKTVTNTELQFTNSVLKNADGVGQELKTPTTNGVYENSQVLFDIGLGVRFDI